MIHTPLLNSSSPQKARFSPSRIAALALLFALPSAAFAQQQADEQASELDQLLEQARQQQGQEAEKPATKLDNLLAQAREQQQAPAFAPFPELEFIPPISEGLLSPAVYQEDRPLDSNELRVMQEYQRELAKRLRSATCTIRIGQGSGSGVFVSHDGLIASAAHVTGTPGKEITVVLADGTELKARSLTQEPGIDGSFAMVEPGELKEAVPWVELAEMGEQEVGDWTVTCGNSGGWDEGRGSVIRVGRIVRLGSTGTQTDAPLIGGDSGGPIVDINGRLIGTNSRVGGTARHSLHVPLPYFHAFFEEAQDQFVLSNEQGVEAMLESFKAAEQELEQAAEDSALDELLDQAREAQQAGPLDDLLDQAREAQQAN